jgi:hypothetical protein
LVFNAEVPTTIKPPNEDAQEQAATATLINFQKFRITSSIIRRFLILQQFFGYTGLDEDLRVYPKCLFLRTVDSEVLRNISQKCEP